MIEGKRNLIDVLEENSTNYGRCTTWVASRSCGCLNENKSTKAFLTLKKYSPTFWGRSCFIIQPSLHLSRPSSSVIQIRQFHATFCITNKCLIVWPPLLTKLARVKWVANQKRIQWRIWFQFLCVHFRISPQIASQVSSLRLRTYVARPGCAKLFDS